jgi:hypothetical protein
MRARCPRPIAEWLLLFVSTISLVGVLRSAQLPAHGQSGLRLEATIVLRLQRRLTFCYNADTLYLHGLESDINRTGVVPRILIPRITPYRRDADYGIP